MRENSDLLTIGNFVKYGRPDWMESIMKRFYGELRGEPFMYKKQNFERVYAYSTNRRCSVVLFQSVDFNPVGLIEKMSRKVECKKVVYHNSIRDTIDNLKSSIEIQCKQKNWIVIENINLLSPQAANLLIRETTTLMEKSASHPEFRVWVVYQLPNEMLSISKNKSPGNHDIPLWFGMCYYAFLDRCMNIAEDMKQLYSAELSHCSQMIQKEIEQNLVSRDKGFMEVTKREMTKSNSNILNTGNAGTSNKVLDIPFALDDHKDQVERSIDHRTTSENATANLNLEGTEAMAEKPLVIVEKRVKCNLMEELSKYQTSKTKPNMEEYQKNKERIIFLLKLLASILRQRKLKLQRVSFPKKNPNVMLIKDKQMHSSITYLVEECGKSVHKEPYQALLNGFLNLFSDWMFLDDPFCSPLLVTHYFYVFFTELPKQDAEFDFNGQKYFIPGPKRFTTDLGATIVDSVLTFPTEDSNRFLGLRPNDESVVEYSKSKACFRFLTSRMSILELLDDHSNYLEDFDLKKFAEDNKKPNQEIISRFFLNNIEYGYNLIENHEFKSELKSDLKRVVNNVLSMFSEKSYKEIGRKLEIDEKGDDLSASDNSNSDEDDMSIADKIDSRKRLSKLAVPKSGSSVGHRFSLLETQTHRGSGGISSRKGAVRGSNAEGENENVVDQRLLAEDFFKKTGITPKKSKVYFTFNLTEKYIRDNFKRALLIDQFNILALLLSYLSFDLNQARFYLEGDVLSQYKSQAKLIVDCISNNQVPASWVRRVESLNVDTSSFKNMVKSIVKKLDSLYSMAVELEFELPPILNLSRFISPRSLLITILAANSAFHEVSFTNSVIMLMQGKSDTDKIYQKSTVWTISGLKIRGGILDGEGRLANEDERAKPFDLGPLHLEITQFDQKEDEKGKMSSLSTTGEISLMLNTNFEEEKDKTIEFLNEINELKKNDKLDHQTKRKTPLNSGTTTPAQPGSRRDSVQLLPGQTLTGLSKHQANLTTGNQASTPSKRRMSLAPTVEKTRIQVVRLPVFMGSSTSCNPLTDLPVYFYCYSMLPQSHWIERCTYITLDESDAN
jgi:hypothetical protein